MLNDFLEVSSQTSGKITFSDQNLLAYLRNLNASFENQGKVSQNLISLEKLGEGTFGEVVKVFDVDNKMFFAEKRIKQSSYFRRDVLNEIISAFHIHLVGSPEVLQIFKLEYVPEISMTITMECGIGTLEDLYSFISSKKIVYENFLDDIYAQIMRQLELLQDNMLCHRDLKPSNIIVTDGLKYKLADFGLSEKLTKIGKQEMSYKGTKEYMLPEMQAMRSEGKCIIDPYEADLYATKKIIDIGHKLEVMELKKISKKEFELAFKSEMSGKIFCKVGDFEQRNKIIKAYRDLNFQNEAVIKLEREKSLLDPQFSNYNKRKSEILDILGEISFSKLDYIKSWEHYLESYHTKLQIYPEVSDEIAIAYDHLGKLMKTEKNYSDALDFYNNSLSIRVKLHGQDHVSVAESFNNIGTIHLEKESFEEARDFFSKALTCCSKVDDEVIRIQGLASTNLGVSCFKLKEFEDAIGFHRNAIQILEDRFNYQDIIELALPYNNLGFALRGMFNAKEAVIHHKQALKIYNKNFSEDHVLSAQCLIYIADCYEDMNDVISTIDYIKKAIQIFEKIEQKNSILLGSLYERFGDLYVKIGEHRHALNSHLKYLEVCKKNKEVQPKHKFYAHLKVAEDYYNCEQIIDAIQNYQEFIKIFERTDQRLSPYLFKIGECYRKVKSFDDALVYFKKLEELLKTEPASPLLKDCKTKIGDTLAAKGDLRKSINYLKKSTEKMISENGEPSLDSALSLINLGSKYQAGDLYKDALVCYRRAHFVLMILKIDDENAENPRDKILSCFEQIKEKSICIKCMVKVENMPHKFECEHVIHTFCISTKQNSCSACLELEQLFSD